MRRKERKRTETPTVALAGYTNVGKSTLLNALTGADVSVENRLFETLDPTTRGFEHDGKRYLVTDTVGFIRRLPTQLVEGFASTLEETLVADLVLHVADASAARGPARGADRAPSRPCWREIGARRAAGRARAEQGRPPSTRSAAPAREPLPRRAAGLGRDRARGSTSCASASPSASPTASRTSGCSSRTTRARRSPSSTRSGRRSTSARTPRRACCVRARLPRREVRALRAVPRRRARRPARSGSHVIELPIARLREDAVLPAQAYAGDAGLDLARCERVVTIGAGRAGGGRHRARRRDPARATPGSSLPRSGLAARHGIDDGQRARADRLRLPRRGARWSCSTPTATSAFTVEPGMRIAQLVVAAGARRRARRGRRAAGERARRRAASARRGRVMRAEPRVRVSAHPALARADPALPAREAAAREVWLLPGGGVHSGESLIDALAARARRGGRASTRAAGRGPVAIVDSIAPERSLGSKHVVHIIFAGDARRLARGGRLAGRGGARATGSSRSTSWTEIVLHPPIQRFLQRWQPGRSGRLPRRAVDALERMRSLRLRRPTYAARFLAVAGRPAGRDAGRDATTSCVAALGGPLPDGAEPRTGRSSPSSSRRPSPGSSASPSGPVLRLRHRRRAARRARGRLARVGVGPERRSLRPPSPAAAVVEEVAAEWLRELLGLPDGVSCGFVTGCAGRATRPRSRPPGTHVLAAAGWDVARTGLAARREIRVLVGGERHVTIDRSLRLLGLGTARSRPSPPTTQGRMRADGAARGARGAERAADRLRPGRQREHAARSTRSTRSPTPCEAAGAWLHVDGAFGLWAAASPRCRHLVAGRRARRLVGDGRPQVAERAVRLRARLLRHPGRARRGDGASRASYLQRTRRRAATVDWVPEFSRRARGFAVWAALRALGRDGVAELVERCCDHAQHVRGAARRRAGRRDPERRRPQPGARALRRRRRDDPRGRPARAGGRHLLARRHRLAGRRRCGSRSRASARRTMSNARRRRSWKRPAAAARQRPTRGRSMSEMAIRNCCRLTADYASQYLGSLDERPVRAIRVVEELREALGGPLPDRRRRRAGRRRADRRARSRASSRSRAAATSAS